MPDFVPVLEVGDKQVSAGQRPHQPASVGRGDLHRGQQSDLALMDGAVRSD